MGKSICLVTVEFDGLTVNGGIGSYYNEVAKLLSRSGWSVVVLFYSGEGVDIGQFAERYYASYGIPIFDAGELCGESGEDLQEIGRDCIWSHARSHVFHEALQVLIEKYGYEFDLIEFSDCYATAFVPVSMKKNLGCYENSRLIVKLHSPSQWHFDGLSQEWQGFDDTKYYYIERYAVENADVLVSPTYHLIRWCKEHGWNIRPDASICGNPFLMDPASFGVCGGFGKRKEIVFFGRFEERKGLIEYIEALNYIKSIQPGFASEYKLTFVGKANTISKEQITSKLPGYNCQYMTFMTKEEAIRYLVCFAGLVVLPSKLDNFPNTVIECMGAGVPFVTSRSGGIPEILGIGSELYASVSCDIDDPRNLGDLIIRYLGYDDRQVRKLLDLSLRRVKEVTDPDKIIQWYEQRLLENIEKSPGGEIVEMEAPWVTVIIPTRNLTTSRYLEATLKSLLAQTYRNVRIVVEDSSTEPKALMMLKHLKMSYGSIEFNHRDNNGIGSALNLALPQVDTKYVMEVDGDNIAKPEMIGTFVECMERRKDVAALSCYYAAFKNQDEPKLLDINNSRKKNFKPYYYFKPTGMCLPLLLFENTQGDANSIFLTSVLKSIGGWPDEKRKGFQDWSLWIKLLANGYEADVIRKVLYYYRIHGSNYIKSKKLFDVDQVNLEYIHELALKRPEFFFMNCYEGIHRLIRRPSIGLSNPANANDVQELEVLRKSTLYAVGKKMGHIAERSPKIKKTLELSGAFIKKVLSKN
jgi:glycosyltransferase involved in cell wall biosynthesis/GT2 family glycosyltransferase